MVLCTDKETGPERDPVSDGSLFSPAGGKGLFLSGRAPWGGSIPQENKGHLEASVVIPVCPSLSPSRSTMHKAGWLPAPRPTPGTGAEEWAAGQGVSAQQRPRQTGHTECQTTPSGPPEWHLR